MNKTKSAARIMPSEASRNITGSLLFAETAYLERNEMRTAVPAISKNTTLEARMSVMSLLKTVAVRRTWLSPSV